MNNTPKLTDGLADQNQRIKDNLAEYDWRSMDLEALEECFEDRDPLEFI